MTRCTVAGKAPINPDDAPVPNSVTRPDGQHVVTSMPQAIAETYAAEPGYYGSTFCCGCGRYLPVGANGEFVWSGTNDRVGT